MDDECGCSFFPGRKDNYLTSLVNLMSFWSCKVLYNEGKPQMMNKFWYFSSVFNQTNSVKHHPHFLSHTCLCQMICQWQEQKQNQTLLFISLFISFIYKLSAYHCLSFIFRHHQGNYITRKCLFLLCCAPCKLKIWN